MTLKKKPISIFVCGDSFHNGYPLVEAELKKYKIKVIITGDMTGISATARTWALRNHVPELTFSANWGLHGSEARAICNTEILNDWKPDLVISFDDPSNAVSIAEHLDIPVVKIKLPKPAKVAPARNLLTRAERSQMAADNRTAKAAGIAAKRKPKTPYVETRAVPQAQVWVPPTPKLGGTRKSIKSKS